MSLSVSGSAGDALDVLSRFRVEFYECLYARSRAPAARSCASSVTTDGIFAQARRASASSRAIPGSGVSFSHAEVPDVLFEAAEHPRDASSARRDKRQISRMRGHRTKLPGNQSAAMLALY